MSSKLKIHEEELGRFLLAYYRGVFPKSYTLGASFLLFYGIMGYEYLKRETDEDRALEFIKGEFTGRLS